MATVTPLGSPWAPTAQKQNAGSLSWTRSHLPPASVLPEDAARKVSASVR